MRDEKVKRNFAYRSRHHPRRQYSPTFMEFVHRQEERREHHEQEMSKHASCGKSVEKSADNQRYHAIPDTFDTPPVPLISAFDLFLSAALMFLFITMLLLFMN